MAPCSQRRFTGATRGSIAPIQVRDGRYLDFVFAGSDPLGPLALRDAQLTGALGLGEDWPGAPPIKTAEGWLNIFHGVRTQCVQHYVYQLGVSLLDLDDPSKVSRRPRRRFWSPKSVRARRANTQRRIYLGRRGEDNGEVKVYYGGADTVQCVATTTIDELLYACKHR